MKIIPISYKSEGRLFYKYTLLVELKHTNGYHICCFMGMPNVGKTKVGATQRKKTLLYIQERHVINILSRKKYYVYYFL